MYPNVALIQTVPLKPSTTPSRGPQTTTSQIHVLIDPLTGNATGGAPILSYEINYDSGTSFAEWTSLKGFYSNDLSLFYIQGGLIINLPYAIRYRAKNVFGWSEYSDYSLIYTIMTPDQAEPVTSALIGTNVMFSWIEPDSRGAAIVSYNVYI